MKNFSDDQIIQILRRISAQELDSLDDLDLDSLPTDERVKIMVRWLEIKAERALQRKARLAEWAFLQRKKGTATQPADVLKDFLASPEFMIALGVMAAAMHVVSGLVELAVIYRRAHLTDRSQARILSNYISAKLSDRQVDQIANIECLDPDLRILANAVTPAEAQGSLDLGDSLSSCVAAFKKRGRAFAEHYERPLALIGVAVADIHSCQPWGLPWHESDLPPLPNAKPRPAPKPELELDADENDLRPGWR